MAFIVLKGEVKEYLSATGSLLIPPSEISYILLREEPHTVPPQLGWICLSVQVKLSKITNRNIKQKPKNCIS